MKKIEIGCSTVEEAYYKLRYESGKQFTPTYCDFNGAKITSEDTLDETYKKVTGKTKSELDAQRKEEQEEYQRGEEAHKLAIPRLTKEYIEKGKAILKEEFWKKWESCVPIRLDDLYQGMEL